ncbi:hypothetical protein Sphch_3103 [Sphingobium chlorophenolicum L-1]|uniref:Uncharacterized protein n=1 Tax=Sphingobium chlorophenolicum L-1 TaxID=690566 RepID=F6F2Q7_SPHCR|nr:hypothetical protein Sphch_3103 [Sphingobium chlorophenolicum L-1]
MECHSCFMKMLNHLGLSLLVSLTSVPSLGIIAITFVNMLRNCASAIKAPYDFGVSFTSQIP